MGQVCTSAIVPSSRSKRNGSPPAGSCAQEIGCETNVISFSCETRGDAEGVSNGSSHLIANCSGRGLRLGVRDQSLFAVLTAVLNLAARQDGPEQRRRRRRRFHEAVREDEPRSVFCVASVLADAEPPQAVGQRLVRRWRQQQQLARGVEPQHVHRDRPPAVGTRIGGLPPLPGWLNFQLSPIFRPHRF